MDKKDANLGLPDPPSVNYHPSNNYTFYTSPSTHDDLKAELRSDRDGFIRNGHRITVSRSKAKCEECGESHEVPEIFDESVYRPLYMMYAVGEVSSNTCPEFTGRLSDVSFNTQINDIGVVQSLNKDQMDATRKHGLLQNCNLK